MDPNRIISREAMRALLWFGVITMFAIFTPVAGLVVWFYPIPIILLTVLDHKWLPILLSALTVIPLLLLGLGFASFLFALGVYFIGYVMGESIHSSDAPHMPLVTGTLVFIMLALVLLALLHWNGIDIYKILLSESTRSVKDYKQMFPQSGSVQQLTTDFSQRFHLLIPGMIVVFSFFLAAVNLVIARGLLRRQALALQPLLSSWQLPTSAILVYILALTAVVFGFGKGNAYWWQIVNNTTFIAGFLIGIQGIAFLWRKVKDRPFRHGWLAIFIITSIIISELYILLGLIDSMIRIRRV